MVMQIKLTIVVVVVVVVVVKEHASSKNRNILNFRVMAVHDIKL